MGSQFWWFYDALAAAVILLYIFISGKKGLVRSLLSFAGYIIAAVMAVSISGGLGKSIHDGIIKTENVKKLNKTLDSTKLVSEVSNYLSAEYNRNVRTENLLKIYKSDQPFDKQIYTYINNINVSKAASEKEFLETLHMCYADITKNIVGTELSSFAAETAAKEVLAAPESFNELIPLLLDDETKTPAAKYIAENYTSAAYTEVIRLITLLGILFAVIAISLLLTKSLGSEHHGEQSLASHAAGSLVGVLKGVIAVFAIAVTVRLYVILGNDNMLFFNFDAIENTYIFKYFYNLVTNHL